jgi:hypothetical protein
MNVSGTAPRNPWARHQSNNSPLRRHTVRYLRIAVYFLDLGILSFDVHRRGVVVYSNIV